MRTHVIHGLAAMAAVVLAACSNTYPQQPKDPINADPKPQQAINDPQVQSRGVGTGPSQKPLNDPGVQQPALNQPSSQDPATQHASQKPFYGPGLVPPDERADALQKSKTQPLASDGEVLSVVMALNDGEVQMAEVAKRNAENADVKNFAIMMSQHHTQGMAKVRSMQGKTKLELKDNDLTAKVRNDASQNMALLRDKKGKEFDRLYMDSQVRMHKDALDALDNRVIPSISNGEVKTGVNEMRRQVAEHLTKAESIQKKLDPSLADARNDGDDKSATSTTTSGTVNTKADTKADVKPDTKSDAKAAKKDTKEAAKDAKHESKDAAKDAKQDTKKAAKDTKQGAKDAKQDVKEESKEKKEDMKH